MKNRLKTSIVLLFLLATLSTYAQMVLDQTPQTASFALGGTENVDVSVPTEVSTKLTTTNIELVAVEGRETAPTAYARNLECCDIGDFEATLVEDNGDFSVVMSGGTVPVQEVEISLVDYHVNYSVADCEPDDLGIFGTLSSNNINLNGLLLNPDDNNTHSLTWQPGTPTLLNNTVSLGIIDPLTLNIDCCEMDFYFCLKVRVTDANCNVCEKVLCYTGEPPSGLVCVDDVAFTQEDTPVNIDVVSNDGLGLDPCGVIIMTPPVNGTAVVGFAPACVLTYTPDPDFCGVDTFAIRSCDDQGDCCLSKVTVEVDCVNDAPRCVDDTRTVEVNSFVVVDVAANDFDSDGNIDPTTVTAGDGPDNGIVAVDGDGKIIYSPFPGFVGTDTFTYMVCDDGTPLPAQCCEATVTFVVGGTTAPDCVDDTETTVEDTPVDISVIDNDSSPNGNLDPTLVAVVAGPDSGSTAVDASGVVTYSPNPDFCGTDTFVYQVCDEDGNCCTSIVTVTVECVNDAPLCVNDPATVELGAAVVIDVAANDSDSDGNIDPSTVTVITPPEAGTATVLPDGTVFYTPAPGFVGTDTFTYMVCDDGTPLPAQCCEATVTVVVTGNTAPACVDDFETTVEDTPVDISVIDNDSSPNGNLDPSSVTVVDGPDGGTATVDASGVVTYNPDPDFCGTDSFIYEICDADAYCCTARVTLEVVCADDAPSCVDDASTVDANTAITIDVTGNDSDPDGDLDPSSVTMAVFPTNGTVVVNNDGSITYTPEQGFTGTITFEYQVCDQTTPTPLCCTAIVTIDVFGPPVFVAIDDAEATEEGVPVIVQVLDNDIDLEGSIDPTTVTVVDGPDNGTAVVNPDGTITYIPNPSFTGTDIFYYTVCNNATPVVCDEAKVTITVSPNAVACSCGEWDSNTITIDALQNSLMLNAKKPAFKGTFNCQSSFELAKGSYSISNSDYSCATASCQATYTWSVQSPFGAIQQGTGKDFNFDFALSGNYFVVIRASCGELCGSCAFQVSIPY